MIDNCKNILIELNVKYKNFEKYFTEIIRTYMYIYQDHYILYNFSYIWLIELKQNFKVMYSCGKIYFSNIYFYETT